MMRFRLMHKVAICLLGGLLAAHAGAAPVSENELKAAYIYNFALFTNWPAERLSDEGATIVFCGIGRSPVLTALGGLQNKRINDRGIEVRQIAAVEDGRECHVLYVSQANIEAQPHTMEVMSTTGTLLVTDASSIVAKNDWVIRMGVEGGRLQFDVNLTNAHRERLGLSSKLLKLARSVN